jgi:superfamily I DNA/RNA helicase
MSGLISEDETPKRVLLTCYNDPLGLQFNKNFSSDFCDDDEQSIIYAGPFMKTLKLLPGMPQPEFENTNDNDYWENTLPKFLKDNLSKVQVRFDRIIVDEAQDFSPAWIQLLESLLDPDGDDQLFLLFDQKQQLNDRGFEEPSIEDGWVRAELRTNVRNSFEIARLARQFLNGAAAPMSLPSSSGITLSEVTADSEIVEQVKKAIGSALNNGFSTEQILVVASGASLRDDLRRELLLGVAEERFDGVIPCETAHRAKGLEADCVIIAVTTRGIRDSELYVAVTRAISRLIIIGPGELMQRIT